VLDVGLENFIKKLKEADLQASCKLVDLEPKGDAEANKAALQAAVGKLGITKFIDKAEGDLLKHYCETLSLDATDLPADDMRKQIADEVMLTGMESFLNKFNVALLKSHCTEMKLSTSGPKKTLVETLMVHIFELEPLDEDEKKKAGKEKPEKESKSSTKEKGSKSNGKEKKSKDKESTKEKKSKEKGSSTRSSKDKEKGTKAKSSKDKKTEKPTREKFVAPPLETIRKGKYDNFTALYDNFNLPDLVRYCKQQQLRSLGNKRMVIKRILHFLETGEKETTKEKKGKKRARKETKSTEKKEAKETKASPKKKQKTESAAEKKEASNGTEKKETASKKDKKETSTKKE